MSSMLKNLPFSSGYETRLLDPESDRSKICLLFPFQGEREVGKQKYEIAQSQSRENTLSIYVDIVLHCIYFLMTIDMSSSSRIVKLPSSYSFESAEWKVLH